VKQQTALGKMYTCT